jgi:signal peptidase I
MGSLARSRSPMARSRLTAVVAGVAFAAVLGAAWFLLAPTQVGGRTAYALIVGNSMEPSLHRGDLAIVRRRDTYRPGDAVLYESRDLGANVLHRIERIENGRFVFKGDNNDFLDPERPAQEQIVGTLWVSVPAVGTVAEWLREPLHLAVLVALAAVLAFGGVGASLSIGRRAPGRRSPPIRRRPSPAPRFDRSERTRLVAGASCVAVVLGGLALVSFTRPATALSTDAAAYVHQGRFSYEAAVRPSAAYPSGRVSTGEPVFLRLVPRLRVSFDYRLESRRPVAATLATRLDARISDGRGWERTLPLSVERRSAGSHAVLTGTLDLRRLERLVEDVTSLTGSAQAAYTVAVQPHVSVAGRVGGDAVESDFSPELLFDFGDQRLQPNLSGGDGGVGPLAPRAPGSGTRPAAAELSLGVTSVTVGTARTLSLAGLAGLLLLAGLALVTAGRAGRDEHALIERRYRDLLLPLRPPLPEWPTIVELADADALARLAAQHGRMILRVSDGLTYAYVVEGESVAYRYRPAPAAAWS